MFLEDKEKECFKKNRVFGCKSSVLLEESFQYYVFLFLVFTFVVFLMFLEIQIGYREDLCKVECLVVICFFYKIGFINIILLVEEGL